MGELEQAIGLAIKKISGRMQVKQILSGTAVEVGELTCTVELEGSPALFDVRLNAIDDDLESFLTIYPAEGSAVLVAIIENMKTEAVVIRCSEVEKVKMKIGDQTLVADKDGFVFNDGTNGMVKLTEMVGWMKKVSTDLKTLKTLLAASVVAGNGAPLAIVFNPTTPVPEKGTFEDVKIKH
ncbi:MAG: hypothetical protein A2066_18865 [Bacteroidetes bacterium GWB2_41_8]|nr:MAG: hypothetical protein A2066_18865 [Bacteroidetes bacterium GWB2_41_8]